MNWAGKTMKALAFDKELRLEGDYPVSSPLAGEVLIKTSMVGICNTDFEITKGYMGYEGVLGHEFVGEVVEGDAKWLGKRVVGEINCGCGSCSLCAQGLARHCMARQTLGIWQKDGCFSEFFTLPVENLIEVPQNVSDEEAVFCEPIAAAMEIFEQLHIKPADKVALLGDGKLGLCISLVLNAMNVDFVHIGKHENKLAISRAVGVKTMFLNELSDSNNKNFDVVIEATGSVGGFETSLSLVKPRGILVLKSTIAAKEGLNLSPVVIDEITVLGSRCGQFAPAMKLLGRKAIDIRPLISAILPFDKAIEGFEKNKQKDTLKVLLKF